jgi:ankyrin repeat protein
MSPEHVNKHGETALMAAARCGRGEVIGALIDAGAQKDFETAEVGLCRSTPG